MTKEADKSIKALNEIEKFIKSECESCKEEQADIGEFRDCEERNYTCILAIIQEAKGEGND